MPAEGDYASSGVVLPCSLGHKSEIIAVQVAAPAQFNISQVQTKYCRILSAYVFHIGPFHQFVKAVRRVPLVSVHQVVLMAVERSCFSGIRESLHKTCRFGSTGCHKYQCQRECSRFHCLPHAFLIASLIIGFVHLGMVLSLWSLRPIQYMQHIPYCLAVAT